jgi:diguanylate cyclase (GGDEF)-like protein/PAS domain S-box-containing protein
MDIEDVSNKELAIETESLREEIAHLQSLSRNSVMEASLLDNLNSVIAAEESRLPSGLLENGPFGIALIDPQFRIAKANQSLCRMLGYTRAELQSLRLQDVAQNFDACIQSVKQILDGVLPVLKIEEPFLKKNGESFWVQLTASTLHQSRAESKCCVLLVEDIGERKWAERVLQTEKQLLEWLINSSVDGIMAFDRDGFFTVWNPGMERIFDISAKETLGRPAFQACPFLKELEEDVHFAAALKGQKVISKDKCYWMPGAGKPTYFEGYYGPMYNPSDGEIIGGLAIIRNVTERKLAEEEKRNSETRYRELFENAYDIVYTLDLTGNIKSINKAAERILGYSRAEVLQTKFNQLVAPEHKEIVRRMIDRQIADETPVTQELEAIAKDGSRMALEVSNRLIYREGKPSGIQGIARNITERKKAEEDLQQANKKLESWVQQLEQRTREMTLLSEMGDILRACLTMEEVYEVIVRVAQDIFPAQGGALFVMGPLRNIVEAVAEWGDISRVESTFTPDECWALRRGRVHWVEDTHDGLLCKHLHTPPPRGYLCVPMMAQSEAVGILHLAQGEDTQMPEAKQRLAVAVAERAAMALSNLRLHETLKNQSIRDPLTGLFNRSFMEESLELELRRAFRTQHPICMIMISLDNFQMINDNYGQDVSDSILCRTAMLIQANIRKGDIACRFSGYTYVILLPQSGYETGQARAQSLCHLAQTLEAKHAGELVHYISASAGLAVFPGHGQTVDSLLCSAEAALARARGAGGNCVVSAS